MEDDKEMVSTLHKENTEDNSSQEEETLVNEMKEEETHSKESEVNHLKEKQEKGGRNCMISNAAQLQCTVWIIFLLATQMSVLLCQPMGKQTEAVLSAVLR